MALLFFGSMFLWAFVFAWYPKYMERPVLTLKFPSALAVGATLLAVAAALVLHRWVDPTLRARLPEDYPPDFLHWLAMILFSLAFTQLFVLFAPFSWLLRLFRKPWLAAILTVVFGVFVLLVRNRTPAGAMPSALPVELLVFRVLSGLVSVYLFLRGGLVLVWWWSLLLHSRHLFTLESGHI
jgi:hypothetical protein